MLQTAVLSNATAAELHCLLACTSLSFAALTPNTHLWWTDGVTLPDSLRAKQKCYFYHHRPIKISFTHQSCLQASTLTTSLWIKYLLITMILQSMLCLGIEPSADDGILPSFTLSLHWNKLLLRPFWTWRSFRYLLIDINIQLTVKNYALPERGHRRILARGDGVEPSCTKRPINSRVDYQFSTSSNKSIFCWLSRPDLHRYQEGLDDWSRLELESP